MEKTNKIENQLERFSLLSDQDMQDSKTISLSPVKDPCQICGSVGFEGLIITCFQCREVREHTYCTRVPLPSIPDIWLCEVCRSSNGIIQMKDCTLMTAISSSERGIGSATKPENSTRCSKKISHKTRKVRTHYVEDVLDFQTSERDAIYVITARGRLGLHKPSEGFVLGPHSTPQIRDKEEGLGKEERPLFEAFPSLRKNLRTLRLTVKTDPDSYLL